MATYTIVVADADVSVFTSFCATKGSTTKEVDGKPVVTPWGVTEYVQDTINGHINYAKQLAEQADEVTKAAKISAYDTAKPTLDKIAALPEKEAKLVTDILDGKVTADSVIVS